MNLLPRWSRPRRPDPVPADEQDDPLTSNLNREEPIPDTDSVPAEHHAPPSNSKGTPNMTVTRSERARATGRLNDYSTNSRDLYARIADAPQTQWPELLNTLSDWELREMQRMTGTVGDPELKPMVANAVLGRPHRGCWPANVDEQKPW